MTEARRRRDLAKRKKQSVNDDRGRVMVKEIEHFVRYGTLINTSGAVIEKIVDAVLRLTPAVVKFQKIRLQQAQSAAKSALHTLQAMRKQKAKTKKTKKTKVKRKTRSRGNGQQFTDADVAGIGRAIEAERDRRDET